MEKYFANSGGDNGTPQVQHVLELNPRHRIFSTLKQAFDNGDEALVKRYATVLYDQSLLAEGLPIKDMPSYAKAVYELM